MFMDRDGVEVHKLAIQERGQYPDTLIEQAWSIKDSLYGFRRNFSCHLARSGNQSQRKIGLILPAHGASHIINQVIDWISQDIE